MAKRVRGVYVWHIDDYGFPDIGTGQGGQWSNQPDPPAPLAVIHLPNGTTHEVRAPERERLGFRR